MNNRMWLGTDLFSGTFGKKYSETDVTNLLSYCLDIGLDKIDTAECYGNDPSGEELLGSAIGGRREKFIVATKFGHRYRNGRKIDEFRFPFVEDQLNRSLKRLKTSFIDVYYFHSGENKDFHNDELWEMLNKKMDAGIIGKLGLSLRHSLVIEKDYEQLYKVKEYGISVIQTVLNMYSRQSLDFVIPFCGENDIEILGRMPLAKGLLTGKYTISHKFLEGDQRSKTTRLNQDIIKSLPDVTVKEAIEWCKRYVNGIVIGSKSREQIKNNFDLVNS